MSLDDLCQEAKDAGVEAPDDFTVRLVTDIGKVDDRTFNQYAYEGMKAAEECFGFETSYIETATEADYAKNIATALEGGPDVVITVGFLLADRHPGGRQGQRRHELHRRRPVPGRRTPTNYVGVLFNEDEGGYLAGVLAASLSESGVDRRRRRPRGRPAGGASSSTATRPAPSRSTPTSTCCRSTTSRSTTRQGRVRRPAVHR